MHTNIDECCNTDQIYCEIKTYPEAIEKERGKENNGRIDNIKSHGGNIGFQLIKREPEEQSVVSYPPLLLHVCHHFVQTSSSSR